MTLDFPKHKNILLQILKEVFADTSISSFLGFKGRTAAYMFYDLNRHSVDLDFDLLDVNKEREVFEKIQKIAMDHGKIIYSRINRFNMVTIISHDVKSQNIKIEVNLRDFGSRYELKTLLGIPMLVMNREDMFANNLIAMSERVGKTSRDVYDVYFFTKNDWPINKSLVEKRARLPFHNVVEKCVKLLKEMDNRHILDGLGEMLSEPQEDWARAKLRTETIFLLKAWLESEK